MQNFSTSARNTGRSPCAANGDVYSRQVREASTGFGDNVWQRSSAIHRQASRHISPNVPVVFTSISPQNYAALRPPPEITGIITEFDLAKTLSLAERLQPEARRLFVIAGSGEADRRWQSSARKIIEQRGSKFETTFLFELSYSELVAELSKVPKDAIVILLTVFADGEGKAFVPAQVAADLSAPHPHRFTALMIRLSAMAPSAALLRRSNRLALQRLKWRSKS